MIITVLNVEVSRGSKGTRSWEQAEVSYKDENGKVAAKKLMSFNFPEVFSTLKGAVNGSRFAVESQKNTNGYWDWVSVQAVGAGDAPSSGGAEVQSKGQTYNDPRETKEERARRQTLITRQACLNSAIASLGSSVADKEASDILSRAFEFERWVNRLDLADMEDDPV